MEALRLAARTSVQVVDYMDDKDTLMFLKELREEVIDLYMTILIAADESSTLHLFNTHLISIFDFLEKTMQIEGYSDVKVAKLIIALVGDIVALFNDNLEVKGKATAPYIE